MKIKDQAAAALMADPFAVKFICTVICTVDGCGCYERYTTGKHVCVKCQKLKNKKTVESDPVANRKRNKAWYENNIEYCKSRSAARYLKQKEAQIAAVRS